MSNTINKNILISGLNNEIGARLRVLRIRVEEWRENSGNAEKEMQVVILFAKSILALMDTKSQLLNREEKFLNFCVLKEQNDSQDKKNDKTPTKRDKKVKSKATKGKK